MSRTAQVRPVDEAARLDADELGLVSGGAEVADIFLHGGGTDPEGNPCTDGPFLGHAKAAYRSLEDRDEDDRTCIVPLPLRAPVNSEVDLIKGDDTVVWALNPFHTARNPQPSPYIIHDGSRGKLEMMLSFYYIDGKLIRTHIGVDLPPQPWQKQLEQLGLKGREASEDFWRTHALLMTQAEWDSLGMTAEPAPPEWFTALG